MGGTVRWMGLRQNRVCWKRTRPIAVDTAVPCRRRRSSSSKEEEEEEERRQEWPFFFRYPQPLFKL
jgi:hypothetical protein